MENNRNRFKERRVLVTGAGSGIGRATAIALAAEGASVFLVDVNQVGMLETSEMIKSQGGEADSGVCDVRDSAHCNQAVANAVEALGGLDVLCNIAGILSYSVSTEVSDDDWDRVIAVNLTGTFFMTRAALPHLRRPDCAIVNMASAAGQQAVPYGAAYCASKGGVVMLTKSLAVEYAKTGPRVNCICPGGVATPLVAGFKLPEGSDPSLFAHISPRMPAFGQPEEIAAMVAYLASSEARFITGSRFTIDGGQTA